MEATEDSTGGAGVVVLYESFVDSDLFQGVLAPGFEEETPAIAVEFWF